MKKKVLLLALLCAALLLPVVVYAAGAIRPRDVTRAENSLNLAIRNYNRRIVRLERLMRRQESQYARLIARQEAAEARMISRQLNAQMREVHRIWGEYDSNTDRLVREGLIHAYARARNEFVAVVDTADIPATYFRAPSTSVLPYIHAYNTRRESANWSGRTVNVNDICCCDAEGLDYIACCCDGGGQFYHGGISMDLIDSFRPNNWNTHFANIVGQRLSGRYFVTMRRGHSEDNSFWSNNPHWGEHGIWGD